MRRRAAKAKRKAEPLKIAPNPRSFLRMPAKSTPTPPAAVPHRFNTPMAVERNGGGVISQMMGCSLAEPSARMNEDSASAAPERVPKTGPDGVLVFGLV